MRRYVSPALLLALLVAALLPVVQVLAVEPACSFEDGRINARPHRDCAAPVAIFVQGNDIVVLAVDDQPGPDQLAVRAPANGAIPANANTIIATGTNPVSGRPVIVSRLTTGEYQLNTFLADGSGYVVVWYKGREDLYHLDPVTGQPLDGAQPIVAPNATNPSAGSQAPAPVPAGIPAAGSTNTGGASTVVATEEVMISMPAAGSVSLSNCRVTTRRIVRMRTAADATSGEIMTRLPYNTTWTATERTADWFRVIYQNTQGWVSAEFLNPVGACDFAGG
ncbi:MAG: SH3 domain-containing protein [Anaerolineae bacterium]|nr:SH3 domain-containing protein [Anaerolineae bacterium]